MNEYCENHKDRELCSLTNRRVTAGFCNCVCKQRPELYLVESLDDRRAKCRRTLTDTERTDSDMVSVVIPAGSGDMDYIERTIRSVKDNAVGPIEIILVTDKVSEPGTIALGWARQQTNRMVEMANGKYICKLDCHCALSPEWDARMKLSCHDDAVVTPIIDVIDTKTWRGTGRDMGLLLLNQQLQNTRPYMWKDIEDRDEEEETMCMRGCCYMLQKDYYLSLNRDDEDIGSYGPSGMEWAFRVWLTGGRMLVSTDVVCCHLERQTPYNPDYKAINETFIRIGRRWRSDKGKGQVRPVSWLAERFSHHLKDRVRFVSHKE